MKLYIPPKSTNKIFLLISIFLLIFVILSCKDQDNIIKFKSFPVEYKLSGEKLNLIINSPAIRMSLLDTILIIRNPYGEKYFIELYHKDTFKHIKSFCEKGNGPNEFESVGTCSLDNNSSILWVTDFRKTEIVGFNIDSIIELPGYKRTTTILLPKKLHPMMEMANYNSDLFAIPDPRGEVQLYFYNKKGENMNVISKMDIKDIDDPFLSDLTRTHNSIHTGRHKLVMLYRYFDRVIIRNLKNGSFIEIIGPDQIDPKKQLILYDHERMDGYDGKPKFGDEFIYGLYKGTTGTKIDWKIGKMSAIYSKNIHVFGWNGRPVMRLILDHEISDFILDKENQRIIAFAVDAEDNMISYDISNIPEFD